MTAFYLIRIQASQMGYLYEPETLGPYSTSTEQTEAARVVRDEELEDNDLLFWLDIEYGAPIVGAFDPKWYEEAKR